MSRQRLVDQGGDLEDKHSRLANRDLRTWCSMVCRHCDIRGVVTLAGSSTFPAEDSRLCREDQTCRRCHKTYEEPTDESDRCTYTHTYTHRYRHRYRQTWRQTQRDIPTYENSQNTQTPQRQSILGFLASISWNLVQKKVKKRKW